MLFFPLLVYKADGETGTLSVEWTSQGEFKRQHILLGCMLKTSYFGYQFETQKRSWAVNPSFRRIEYVWLSRKWAGLPVPVDPVELCNCGFSIFLISSTRDGFSISCGGLAALDLFWTLIHLTMALISPLQTARGHVVLGVSGVCGATHFTTTMGTHFYHFTIRVNLLPSSLFYYGSLCFGNVFNAHIYLFSVLAFNINVFPCGLQWIHCAFPRLTGLCLFFLPLKVHLIIWY